MAIKIKYNNKTYSVFATNDISGGNSIRDLAEDFAYDVIENLSFVSCVDSNFDDTLQIIEETFFDVMKYSVLPVIKKVQDCTTKTNSQD